jgi:hypothetical protein
MRSWRRRLVFPILILGIAAWLSWQGQRDRAAQRPAVEAFAQQILNGGPYAATEQILVDAIRRYVPVPNSFAFSVEDRDGGPAPDGSASHVILITSGSSGRMKPVVGLRCRYDPDPARIAIVGVFEPPEPSALESQTDPAKP